MKRWLPSPLISLVLFVSWLLLNGTSTGHLVLGAMLAVAIPLRIRRFLPEASHVGHWPIIVRLGLTVLRDIVVSNLQVARLILGPERHIEPRFVWVPIALRDPHAIASLAGIITMTPGTLSADLTDDRRHMLVHALNAGDEAALIADIKARYEAPLRIIFGEQP